jgi:voltage-gated potassium channel Kch
VGLPASLGAFAAGVLLSESEYRHELQANVEPFEGLLLGFFFISVGMSADVRLALAEPGLIIGGTAAMVAVKIAVVFALERLRKQPLATAARAALALPQGSEFAFVLFPAAVIAGALPRGMADRATLIIALSMLLSPMLFALSEALLIPPLMPKKPPPPPFDAIEGQDAPVIIAGLGRVGQIVARILRMQGIGFTALEKDSEQVEQLRRYGNKVFFGDPSRVEVLRAAGAEQARLLVLAMGDVKESLQIAETVQRHFPHLKVVARARDRYHAHQLLDLGLGDITRETYHSSLRMAEEALKALGHPPDRARRDVGLFREHDERLLLEQRAYRDDEKQMIQSTRNAAEELAALLEADRLRAGLPPPSETARVVGPAKPPAPKRRKARKRKAAAKT